MSQNAAQLPENRETAGTVNFPIPKKELQTVLQATPEINPKDLIDKIKRRKWTIVLCMTLATTLAAILLSAATPLYKAETQLMIDGEKGSLIGLQSVITGVSGDSEAVTSEIQVIRSRGLAEKVIDHLQLDQNPEFNETLRPEGFVSRLFAPDGLLGFMSSPPEPLSEYEQATQARISTVDEFLKKVEVTPIPESRVVQITATSADPKLASEIANTLADRYIVEQLEVKFEATQRVNNWLNERVSSLREKVEISELEVERFRQTSGLLQGQTGTLYAEQVSELSTQLISAKAALTEARARLSQTKKAIRSSSGIESATEVLQSGLIQRLREQEVDLERKQAELSAEYGARHPRILNLKAEKAKLQSKIKQEVNKIVQGLENEVSIAGVRVGSLRANLEALKKDVAASNRGGVKLRALERESEANRMLLETFLSRFKETSSQDDLDIQQADARIISPAYEPMGAAFPKKGPILALALLGSAFLGIIIVLFKESFDRSYRSSEQIEGSIGVQVLALVPKLTGFLVRNTNSKIMEYIADNRSSALAESLRNLMTAVQLTNLGDTPKTILVTSANPNEGKSTVAAGMTLVQSLAHRKAIVVDTDLRRSTLGTAFSFSDPDRKKKGLAGYLATEGSDTPTVKEIICHDESTGTAVIPAGRCGAANPSDLINSARMDTLIQALLSKEYGYELVIFDSPPVMASFDAHVLATKTDLTLFIVRWGVTPQKTVQSELKKLARLAPKLASVLSMVDVKTHASYGYGDSGLYFGKLQKYYTKGSPDKDHDKAAA